MMKQGQLPVEQLRTIDNRRTYLTTLRKELSMVQEWNLQLESRDAVKFAEEDGMLMVGNLFGLRGVPFLEHVRGVPQCTVFYIWIETVEDCSLWCCIWQYDF
jgi:hypothetical protein